MINHVSIEDNNTAPDTPTQDYTGTGRVRGISLIFCWGHTYIRYTLRGGTFCE